MFDLFGDPVVEAPMNAKAPKQDDRLAELPEKMRADPKAMHAAKPDGGPQLEEWIRVTQRRYLLWLVGAIMRSTYRESSIANAREILFKLNGMAGEW